MCVIPVPCWTQMHLYQNEYGVAKLFRNRGPEIIVGSLYMVSSHKVLCSRFSIIPCLFDCPIRCTHHAQYAFHWSDSVHFLIPPVITYCNSWWRHQMETSSALLALCAGNSPVAGEFPSQRPVTRSFGVFFDLRLNKRSSREGGDLRRYSTHYDVIIMIPWYLMDFTRCNS